MARVILANHSGKAPLLRWNPEEIPLHRHPARGIHGGIIDQSCRSGESEGSILNLLTKRATVMAM
jgi:hypothetical protein